MPDTKTDQTRIARAILSHDAHPDSAFRALWDLLENGEEIDPIWTQAWPMLREHFGDGGRHIPRTMMARVDEAVAAINATDPHLASVRVSQSDSVCFLLGAGASAPSGIPTVTKLLPELWRRARKVGRDDIDRLAEWCNRKEIDNIEDLLTAAYLANYSAKNTSITELLEFFLFPRGSDADSLRRIARSTGRVDASSIAFLQDTLQILFGLLTGTMIPAVPNAAHRAVVQFLQNHQNASVITTNYDGCVDQALLEAGLVLNNHLHDNAWGDVSPTDLLKIHGSINWAVCESCHDVRDFDLLALKRAYEADSLSYAVIGICKTCGGQRRPLLIPPLAFKFIMFPNLIRLWHTARDRIEQSHLIVVVGFSFSEADSYINKIIERSMNHRTDQRIVVCDPDPGLHRRLKLRFATRIDGFDERRILYSHGSADEVVPKLVELLLTPSTRDESAKDGAASACRAIETQAATQTV